MIPQAYITEWANKVPWQTNEQVEQDLVICRALVEIFSDAWLASRLAFRGGTALHKLYLQPQPRYSEDIDLVQIRAEPIKETIKRLQERLSFIGNCTVAQRANNNTLKYRFESEFPPLQNLRIKVEINCREHFTVMGYQQTPFQVNSSWFTGACNITTYTLEELLGTKLRALYQRKKGRDLYDIYKALVQVPEMNKEAVVQCYQSYMEFVSGEPPTQKVYLQNMQAKMQDDEFSGDIAALIRPTEQYDQQKAFDLVRNQILEKIDDSLIGRIRNK
ncbi:MAG TPA: nucleotidyl transferase AbiEii/AbiGii toxin family protein [Bacteroidales bacterium]|nr:nucleotidyl transferase AbiEii/AbiGii toxin family protein [Bacteroidales bacterium]